MYIYIHFIFNFSRLLSVSPHTSSTPIPRSFPTLIRSTQIDGPEQLATDLRSTNIWSTLPKEVDNALVYSEYLVRHVALPTLTLSAEWLLLSSILLLLAW